jgi:FixJ family two-component response regulator
MVETAVNVFVVDDDEADRTGIRELLASVGMEARTFASGEEFLHAYEPAWHGCLILDVRMPGMSGLILQDELIRRHSDLSVLFLTGHGDVRMAAGALKKGAVDFVEKPVSDQELLDLVHQVLRSDADRQEWRATMRQVKAKLETLTPRERAVLDGIRLGKDPKTLARELHVSRKTVDWHARSLRNHLGVPSNEQLLILLGKYCLLFETDPGRLPS